MRGALRALIDTNVLISYLLPSGRGATIQIIVEAALRGEYRLLLAEGVAEEVKAVAAEKRYLAARIQPGEVEGLMDLLVAAAELISPISAEIPRTTRDPKDDFLLAYAAVSEADYLVTGDRDLLDIAELAGLKIVTPARFAEILKLA